MTGVDPDPDRLGDRFRLAAPQPGCGGEVRESLAALGVAPVTGRAIVAEQRAARLAYELHQARVALYVSKARLLDAVRPRRALDGRLLHRFGDDGALVVAKKPLGEGRP